MTENHLQNRDFAFCIQSFLEVRFLLKYRLNMLLRFLMLTSLIEKQALNTPSLKLAVISDFNSETSKETPKNSMTSCVARHAPVAWFYYTGLDWDTLIGLGRLFQNKNPLFGNKLSATLFTWWHLQKVFRPTVNPMAWTHWVWIMAVCGLM